MGRPAGVLLCASLFVSPSLGFAQASERRYLSGTDKDQTVAWDFQVSGGRHAGEWATIPVPSNWELQGFGTYKYGGPLPRPDEKGRYRLRFETPRRWRGQRVDLVFEGSMTDTEAWIDGESVGPKHQGAFYEFRYDVTALLRPGARQRLEVLVSKESSNESVNSAERHSDFWIFGGIYRPVYLEARPAESIESVAIDARHDGAFRVDVFVSGVAAAGTVTAQVETTDGQPVGAAVTVPVAARAGRVTLETHVDHPAAWTAETPNLYRVVVSLGRDGRALHRTSERFGFRTVELRPRDGLYVNGVKVRLKGVNRHSFWPDSGRTTSRAVSETDVRLIKDMNMNAVRMSHYPPDRHFLEVCDELGLFVLDELTGWQHRYDTEVGEKLVRELVVRDVNHPSVIVWDNGNEGGFNDDLDDDFHLYDPQKRPVIHPWQDTAGQINTTHYRSYDCCAGKYLQGPELVMPTEVLHGLYDGGHGAGLFDLWNRMLQNPLAVGAFLWALADEGIVRTDRGGALDTDGNHAPDGIVGPYREKEASFFTIKHVWSPVFLELGRLDRLPPTFDGRLRLENRYDFTNLAQLTFAWRLVRFPGPDMPAAGPVNAAQGTLPGALRRARRPRHARAPPAGRLARGRRALPRRVRRAGPRHRHVDLDAQEPRGRAPPRRPARRARDRTGSGWPGGDGSGRHARRHRPRHGPSRLGRARRPARLSRERAAHRRGQGHAHLTRAPCRRRRLRGRSGLRGQPEAGAVAPRRQRLARAVLPLREPGSPRIPRRDVRLPGGPGRRACAGSAAVRTASGRTGSRGPRSTSGRSRTTTRAPGPTGRTPSSRATTPTCTGRCSTLGSCRSR